MRLLWPWALAGLAAVVAAAYWALRRPTRQVAPVSSLRLWERAIRALGPSAGQPSRRITASWALLLLGAAAAVLAGSGPEFFRDRPARRIALVICPSAELAGAPDEMATAAGMLLGRLDAADRVRLVAPAPWSAPEPWLSPPEALKAVRAMAPLPVSAEELTVPTAAGDVQHVYRLLPASLRLPEGADSTNIYLPARPGVVTIDALAAAEVAGEGDRAVLQVFVAVRNHSTRAHNGEVLVKRSDGSSASWRYQVPAGGRAGGVVELRPGGDYYEAAVAEESGWSSRAFLARQTSPLCRLVLIGREDPLVRRFLQVNPAVKTVASPVGADAVVAVGVDPPAGAAALVIDPPSPPPGWSADAALEAVALRDAATLADDPLTKYVDFSGVSVRRSAAWRAGEGATGRSVLAVGGRSLILAQDGPPRVYVAFDTSTENTNLALTDAFVIFLANATRFLAPAAAVQTRYEYRTPLACGPAAGLAPVATVSSGAADSAGESLPLPGVYRDVTGALQAVSLVGLTSAEPDTPPEKKIRALALPAPAPLSRGVELTALLALAAIVFWLAGWRLRLR